jgi:hypothetical protein
MGKRTSMKKSLLSIAIFFAVAGFIFSPVAAHTAYAADSCIPLPGYGFVIGKCFSEASRVFLYEPSSWLLVAAGYVFDVMVKLSLQSETFNEDFITKGWALVRDLMNMTFIFVMLYIAIATILQLSGYNTKKLLGQVIVMALLVNFSLPLTRVVIDFSNVLALGFYNAITAADPIRPGNPTSAKDLAALYTSSFNPERITSTEIFNTWLTNENGNYSAIVLIYLVGVAVNIATSYALFLAGFLFMGRIAMLWFLIIASPVAFVASILPFTQEHSKKWWSALFNQAFLAPVFLFLFYLIAQLIVTGTSVTGTNGGFFAGTLQIMGPEGSGKVVDILMNIVLKFAIVIILLFIAIKTAKKMSGEVAGAATKIASYGMGAALGVATGGAAFAARNVIGRAASTIASSQGLLDASARSGPIGIGARLALRGVRGVAGGSFDARAAGPVAGAFKMGGISPQAGLNIQKGGFTGQAKRYVERQKTFATSLETPERAAEYAKTVKGSIWGRMAGGASGRASAAKAVEGKAQNIGDAEKIKKIEEELRSINSSGGTYNVNGVATPMPLRKDLQERKAALEAELQYLRSKVRDTKIDEREAARIQGEAKAAKEK